ncbi:MAG: peptidase M3, partial [Spirochaetaceae bacterium]|nr:peptidase M3 [Spirochaetaceae bacterium]
MNKKNAGNLNGNIPKWNLNSVYASFDSPEYIRDIAALKKKLAAFLKLAQNATDLTEENLLALIHHYEAAGDLAENLGAYTEAVWTANTKDKRALAELNVVEDAKLPMGKAAVIFRKLLAGQKENVFKLAETSPKLHEYSFFLHDAIKKAAFQMDALAEDLANDLSRCGGDAWCRLHETLLSNAKAALGGTNEQKTITQLRSMAHNFERSERKAAYDAEIDA